MDNPKTADRPARPTYKLLARVQAACKRRMSERVAQPEGIACHHEPAGRLAHPQSLPDARAPLRDMPSRARHSRSLQAIGMGRFGKAAQAAGEEWRGSRNWQAM